MKPLYISLLISACLALQACSTSPMQQTTNALVYAVVAQPQQSQFSAYKPVFSFSTK